MSMTVYVPPKPQHYFWEEIFNEEEVGQFLKKLKDPNHYCWITNRKWVKIKKLKMLLTALVKINIFTCHLDVYPYKREIWVYIKGPDDPGGGKSHKTICYKESDPTEKITGTIARVVGDYWQERIRGPVSTSKKVFADCAKYL